MIPHRLGGVRRDDLTAALAAQKRAGQAALASLQSELEQAARRNGELQRYCAILEKWLGRNPVPAGRDDELRLELDGVRAATVELEQTLLRLVAPHLSPQLDSAPTADRRGSVHA